MYKEKLPAGVTKLATATLLGELYALSRERT